MPLLDYTYKLGDSGVILNDDSLSTPFVDINKVVGLDSPPFRETIRDHEGADGGFMDAEFEKGREIALEGTAYCEITEVESYMDDLRYNYAPVTSPVPFYFKGPGVEERLLFVKPRGVRYDIDQLRRIGATAVQFLLFAEDPRIYTNTLESGLVPFVTPTTTGISFNLGFNLDFGGGAATGSTIVTNNGNRPAPVIFDIVGPCTNPVITNVTLSKTLRFDIILSSTDHLVIDTLNRTVLLNGISNRRGSLVDPNWFDLAVGDNFIGYSAASGVGSSLSIEFRAAWR